MANATKGTYEGVPAIWLTAGRYEAAIVPEIGGNLVAFRDVETGDRYIREPGAERMESFCKRPTVHGIPVLFPPNRYEDGKLPWNGTTYELPLTEPQRNNHIHGFFLDVPWQVDGYGADELTSYVVLAQRIDESHALHAIFPHAFTFKMRYSLTRDGLKQEIGIRNDGSTPMPCMLGFHTSLHAPFAPDSTRDDYTVRMTIGQRVDMSERMLPTGRLLPLTAEEEQLRGAGITPYFASLDHHYTAEPQDGRNVMELSDHRAKRKLIYEVGPSYKFWMIYNAGAADTFFCPEPQTNMVNAPSAPFSAEETGLISLAPGDVFEETCRFYVETIEE